MNFLYSSYGLDYQNPECNFLNINLEKDTRLFVDAYAMSRSSNVHMQLGHKTLRTFMSETLVGLKNYLQDQTTINNLIFSKIIIKGK
jgi:hypothetical protein